jgi:glycosyltransferase involved in cell wall biosynthesis
VFVGVVPGIDIDGAGISIQQDAGGRCARRKRRRRLREPRALWVSTSVDTKGGIATFVRGMSNTPLWQQWNVAHVATHRDGSVVAKIGKFCGCLPSFIWQLTARRPAVVHLHVASYGSFYRKFVLSVIALSLRVPVVTHVHGGQFDVFYKSAPRIVQPLIKAMLTRSSAVVTLGRLWADRLRDIAPDAAVCVMPNAVRAATLVDQPALGDAVRVLFVGRVEADKGTFDLLNAWRKMLDASPPGPQPLLTVVGDGDLGRATELAQSLGITDTVEFTGWVDPARVPAFVRRSQVFVLPSYFEGQPMSILEAMANGLCVVSTPVGGIPDLIDDRCGILVEPGDVEGLADALREVTTNAVLRTALGSSALTRVRDEFEIDGLWRRFDTLYRQVVR